ncbi:hypothetical protein RND81_11G064300 [Saponaria officinalis]|uniref:Retrotransposon gag domain-containing protein n=1 Tax=Saponaria officinalis TaxID=3572 RepID=A0AAW1HKC9_SAPOF
MPPKKRSDKRVDDAEVIENEREAETVTLPQEYLDRLLSANEALSKAVRAMTQDRAREQAVTASTMSSALARQQPPTFNGTEGPAALADWMRKFTKMFTTIGCPEEMKVDQAASYLLGRADTWWCTHQDRLKVYHVTGTEGEEVFGWKSFQKALRDEFFPEHLRHAKRAEFDNFKMREGMTVEEYYTEFMDLAAFSSDLGYKEDVLAARFERGLSVHILEKMQGGTPTTVSDMYLRAGYAQRLCDLRNEVRAEKRKSEGSEAGDSSKKRGSYSQPTRAKSESATSPMSRPAFSGGGGGRGRACGRCSRVHPGKTCDGRFITCFELGHKAVNCYRRTRGQSQDSTFRAPTTSFGSGSRGGGNQWRGGTNSSGGRGAGGQFQQGGGSTSQGGVGGLRGGFGGRGRGGFGGGATSASTVQGGVKNTGQLYAMTREEAQGDDHIVTGTGE